MDFRKLFENYVLNPLDSDSTLPGLNKKLVLIVETFRLARIIKNIIVVLIAGFILFFFFQISTNIVVILVAFEIQSILLISYIRYREIKSLSSLLPVADGRSFRDIIVTREYYNVIIKFVAFLTSAISIGLINLFLNPHYYLTLYLQNAAVKNLNINHVILFFAIFRLIQLIVKFIRYQIIRGVGETENLAQVNQSFSLIYDKFELINFVPVASLLLFTLFFIGIPGFIILIFSAFILLMVVFSIIEIKRIGRLDFSINAPVENINNILVITGEKVVGIIFGIMNLRRTGFAFLGVGKTNKPENTLLVTDKRLLFVQIPIPGSNKIVDGMVYSDMNFFWNRGEIKEKGQQIMDKMSLEEIVKLYGIYSVSFDEISNLKLHKMEFTVLTIANQKLKYMFMDREYVNSLKQWLRVYLNEKFVEVE